MLITESGFAFWNPIIWVIAFIVVTAIAFIFMIDSAAGIRVNEKISAQRIPMLVNIPTARIGLTTTVTRDKKPANVVNEAIATGLHMSSIVACTTSRGVRFELSVLVSSKYRFRIWIP